MDPVTIISGLIGIAPTIAKWIGGDKAAETAEKVVGIAQAVTGKSSPQEAVDVIKADPALAMQFQQALMAFELEMEREETKRLQAVNETMRVEAGSEHFLTYSWRPIWGYVSAGAFLILVVAVCFLAYQAVFSRDQNAMSMIPALVSAATMLFAIPGGILGVASWKRGQEKIEKIKAAGGISQ